MNEDTGVQVFLKPFREQSKRHFEGAVYYVVNVFALHCALDCVEYFGYSLWSQVT